MEPASAGQVVNNQAALNVWGYAGASPVGPAGAGQRLPLCRQLLPELAGPERKVAPGVAVASDEGREADVSLTGILLPLRVATRRGRHHFTPALAHLGGCGGAGRAE